MVIFSFFRAKRALCLLVAVLLPLAAALPASAALIAVDLTGATGTEATQVFSNPAPQFSSVTLSRVGLDPAPLANGFGAAGWSNFADDNKYLQIDIVPGAGVSYIINSIDFKFQVFSDAWTFRLASSVDDFAIKQSLDVGFVSQPSTIRISMNANLGSEQTGATSFRLYAQSTTGSATQSTGFISASPAIEFVGSAVPEPASTTLLSGSLLLLIFRRRR